MLSFTELSCTSPILEEVKVLPVSSRPGPMEMTPEEVRPFLQDPLSGLDAQAAPLPCHPFVVPQLQCDESVAPLMLQIVPMPPQTSA